MASTFLPVLNEVEKASIGERQPLPDRYLGLSDEELDQRIAAAQAAQAWGAPTAANATTAWRLEPESGLITHGDAIEHVPWRGGSVSLGAFTKTAKRLRPENLRRDR